MKPAGCAGGQVLLALNAGSKSATVFCRSRAPSEVIARDIMPVLETAFYNAITIFLDGPEAVAALIREIDRAVADEGWIVVILDGVGALVEYPHSARALRACLQRHDDFSVVFVSDRPDDLEKLLVPASAAFRDQGGVQITAE